MKSFKNNLYILSQLHRYSKSRIVMSLICMILNVINDLILNIFFLPYILSAVANHTPVREVLTLCGIMIGAMIVVIGFMAWYDNVYLPKSNSKIAEGFQNNLYHKATEIDLICYDDPQFYNSTVWVLKDVNQRAIRVLDQINNWLGDVLMIGSVIGISISFEPIILLFAVVPIAVSMLLEPRINRLTYRYTKSNLLPDRKRSYISEIYSSGVYAKELRLFPQINRPLSNIFEMSTEDKKNNIKYFGKRIFGGMSFQDIFIYAIGSFGALVYLAYQATVSHAIDVGIVVALSNGIWQISGRIGTITAIFPKMQENSLYIENYRRFLGMEAEIGANEGGEEAKSGANGIELRDVSYRYSKDGPEVLHGINMKIKAGEKVAIVGYNGAGKTTLVKLMMRLYEPESGSVVMDGKEAEEYRLESYRSRFGVIFQDYQMYAVSVAENVLMGEYEEGEKGRVEEALKRSGLYERVEEEPDGIETNVMKEYDEKGIIFSGGQAQKMAIARVFARECGIVVMDEPSSALDPVSEYEMHKHMLEASEDKTVVLISHRLSTTRDADRIYYMEHGEIVEEGTHEELMERDGKYAYMFRLQADQYNRQPEVL